MPLSCRLPTPLPCILGRPPLTPICTDYSLEAGLVSFLSSHPAISVPGGFWPLFIDRSRPPSAWPAIVYEVSEVEHVEGVVGAMGLATATVEIDCYSNLYPDVVKLAETIRLALHGFKGWMGCVAVWGVWPEGQDDEVEQPQDGSGVWWYRRGLTYSIQYYEPRPGF